MTKIAIIPARGGSKRLPRKNILPLGGKPLLAYVIEACRESGVFSKVIVSTEDKEIGSVAQNFGATVHQRSDSLAGDRSSVVEVCADVLAKEECDVFCCVYATSALLTSETIKESSLVFSEKQANTLMGVSKYNYSPVQALNVNGEYAELLMLEYSKVQSQFYPETRVSNGSFYWAERSSFLQEETFYGSKLVTFDVPDGQVCDLDTPRDYERLKVQFDLKAKL